MNKTKEYPDRGVLLEYARVCHVKDPQIVFDRITDAMQDTLREHADRGQGAFIKRMQREWDAGRASLRPTACRRTAR